MNDNQTHEWWLRGSFYSLYIDKFAGDIPGLTDRLDYFTKLGVDCLHLLPHYPSPMCDGGYDITDHTAVRRELGTTEDFVRLCTAAHEQGLKVMVDLVLNHTSDQHPWFVEARSSKDNPKRDWFLWSETGTEFAEVRMIFPQFKDSNWIWNDATQDYYYVTFKPCQPELNWSNPEVKQAMCEVIDTLASYGVDGFRLDAIMNLVEQDETESVGLPETHARIRELRTHLENNHPGVILLGEVIGTTRYSRSYFGSGNECHLSYNFELMAEMLYALRLGGSRERLKTVVEAARSLPPHASWMAFLRNHDSLTLSAIDDARAAELLAAVDPDQTYSFANGAETCQRLYSLLNNDESLVREAFSMLYALPSATVLYYGDEIGMPNVPLPAGDDDMRQVVRAPFDWEEADRQMNDQDSLWHHVRQCLERTPK